MNFSLVFNSFKGSSGLFETLHISTGRFDYFRLSPLPGVGAMTLQWIANIVLPPCPSVVAMYRGVVSNEERHSAVEPDKDKDTHKGMIIALNLLPPFSFLFAPAHTNPIQPTQPWPSIPFNFEKCNIRGS
jgi:hypothetical protein